MHVSRLSTMGEVATGMAHELNQPLSAIVNYASGSTRRLQGGTGDPEPLLDALAQIASQAKRASEIIRRLRALVGKQPPSRGAGRSQSPGARGLFLRRVRDRQARGPDRPGSGPGEIPVQVDLVQIEQVLLNLVPNALDALEEVAGAGAPPQHPHRA